MIEKLDAKFYGVIYKIKNNQIVPEDEYMVFLAKDAAFWNTINFYYDECKRLGADEEQLAAVARGVERVRKWREIYPERIKIPDAKGEKLLG